MFSNPRLNAFGEPSHARQGDLKAEGIFIGVMDYTKNKRMAALPIDFGSD